MTNKILVIGLIFTLCMGALGVGFALWSDTLTIAGTINTAKVSLEFTECTSTDPPGSDDPGYTKDVASCQCVLGDSDSDGDNDMLWVIIDNAYPCYRCDFDITVRNNGTMPVEITDVIVNAPDPTAIELEGEGFWGSAGLVGTELDPDETVRTSFWLHTLQQAAQGAVYDFSIQIEAAQYNGECGSGGCEDNIPPTVQVLYPDEYLHLHFGDTLDIQWIATDPNHDDSELIIDLYFSADNGDPGTFFPLPIDTNGDGLTDDVAMGLPNTGLYSWVIPEDNSLRSSTCVIRAVATDPCGATGQDDSHVFCPKERSIVFETSGDES